MTTTRIRRAVAGCVLATLALLTGCGEETAPGEAVPALAQRLDAVDAAISGGDHAGARKAVQALVNEAAQARVDGRLGEEDAEQILQAASAVLERLPTQADPSSPAPAPTPAPTPTPTPDPGLGDLGELPAEPGGEPDEKNGTGGEKKDKDEESDEKDKGEKGDQEEKDED